MIVLRLTILSVLLVVALVAARPLRAEEYSDVAKKYDEFNSQLLQVGPSGREALRRFYTNAYKKSTDDCNTNSYCRLGSKAFLDVITLKKYEVISKGRGNDGAVYLVIIGDGDDGSKRGLIVKWRFEQEEWKIDSITSGPPDLVPKLARRYMEYH